MNENKTTSQEKKKSLGYSFIYYAVCLLIIANVGMWSYYSKMNYKVNVVNELNADLQADIDRKTFDMIRTNYTHLMRLDPFLNSLRDLLEKGVEGTAAFVAFDGDGMGKINEKYGEGAGNYLAVKFGDLVREYFPESEYNLTCNVGERSDEFNMFLSGRESKEALVKEIEAFQEAERNLAVEYDGQIIPGTISIGIAFYDHPDMTIDELYENADEACYRAKEAGKNCTVVFE